ncbi:MAG: ferredoxin reductase family protein [Phycisphaeraceae bacterium]|nr:ferredoxin reductase family protein [Phycisphaerae bacterium]MBX3391418.1 ferredoxin reductase family protein [Phycisphaeraceae bacterium]
MPVRGTPIALALACLYIVLAAFPMAVAILGPLPPPRGPGVEFGVALGFAALGMMGVQFALTARLRWVSRHLGQDSLLQFHRVAGIFAAVLVAGHVAVLITADPAFAAFFDPRVNLMRAGALSAACAALVLVLVLSILRNRLGIPYEWWRLTHGALSMLVVLVAAAHVVMVGHYAGPTWKAIAIVAVPAVAIALLVYVRVVKPWRSGSRPYRVAEVTRIGERVWRVSLEPAGHRGLSFEAGQFAWVTFADSPWSIRQHPFTISSSEHHPSQLEFTIKELGDFTASIGSIRAGSTAYVEGPAGNFRAGDQAGGLLLVAGGIGITPMMSILRTMRDAGDRREVVLIHGVDTMAKAVFAEELGVLANELNLHAVHVPQHPPEGWTGPSGYVTREVLDRAVAGRNLQGWRVLICGPDPMMDGVEESALAMGVDRWNILSERFRVV